jgi:hypothetical protein
VQNNRQREPQAEREEFSKFTADEKEFFRIRKNRNKALFGAIKDQCNDSIGLPMKALANLEHDTSNIVMYDPPEGKEEPAQQWFWDAEREVKYYMSNMPSSLAEEVYQLKRDIKFLLRWLRKNQQAYIPGQRSPWSPANADWNRDPDIEEKFDFPNADTLEESLVDLMPLPHEKYRSRTNALKSTKGSSRAIYRTTTSRLNPLEVLHVRLGHASEDLIKWIVKSSVCDGLGYT